MGIFHGISWVTNDILCAVPNPIVGYRKYHGDPQPLRRMEVSVTSWENHIELHRAFPQHDFRWDVYCEKYGQIIISYP